MADPGLQEEVGGLIGRGGEGGEKPKTIIDKALDGSATADEFKEFIASFIKDQNKLNLRSTHCQLSRESLDFSGDGQLVPVTPPDTPSDKYVEDEIVLTNTARSKRDKVYYEVSCQGNPKFALLCSPAVGEIKAGKSVTLKFRLQVFCTSKIYQMLKISLSHQKPPRAPKGRAVPSATEFQPLKGNGDQALEHELGRLWVAFKIESELSTSVDWDEIRIVSRIAKGGFGTVFQATWRGVEVAVKILNTQELVEEEKEMVKREMLLMSRLASSHIVTYMGSTVIPTQPWSIIMEYVPGGSLTSMLNRYPNRISLRFKVKLLKDIVAGMTYLHAHSIYHRDIKPDNMLVISEYQAAVNLKITDFGTSKASAKRGGLGTYEMFEFNKAGAAAGAAAAAGGDASKLANVELLARLNEEHDNPAERRVTRGVGTLIYQAPEILEGSDKLNIEKTDIYAFGLLMWEVYTTVEPYSTGPTKSFSKWDLEAHVKEGNRPEIPAGMPAGYRQIMELAWAQDPASRPSFEQIAQKLQALFVSLPESQPLHVMDAPPTSQPGAGAAGGAGGAGAQGGGAPTAGVIVDANGVPVPTTGDLATVGWGADMSRVDAEARLAGAQAGTFIVRWSHTTKSYVLTYSKSDMGFQHIAYIEPVPPSYVRIQVDKEDGKKQEYENIFAYVNAMQESGIITQPCNTGRVRAF